jgi:hypothetical protein
LLVGTSSARTVSAYGIPAVQNESTSHETSSLALISNSNTTASPALVIAKTRGTSNGSFTVVSSGDALGVIQFQGADGTQLLAGARISTEVDGTPGANDMPGRLVFSTTADGASSPTERLRITSTGQVRLAGAGITFNGDTATANELDDYEEGTATVSYTTTGGTFTHGGQSLIYTKVGDTVFCRMGLSTATTSPGTGEITITGLPFQVKAAGGANSSFVAGAACGIVHQEVTNSFTTQPFVVVPIQGTSTLKLKASGSTGSFMDATAFANTANNQYNWILTEFWYHV